MSNDLKINIVAQDNTAQGLGSVEQNLNDTLKTAERLIDKIIGLNAAMEKAGSGPGLQNITSTAKEAESAVGGVEVKAKEVKSAIEATGSTSGLKKIASDAVSAQAAIDKTANSVHKAMGTNLQNLQNIGRIIQDMPYGIMGIGNNIQPMVESFARAKTEAGSTGGAVKNLLGAIAGPAGLAMIGIPVVTSLAVAFGPDLVKAINSGATSVDDLKKNLQGIQQYKDFDLTVKIAGLDGIARLKAELAMLLRQKAYLADEKMKADDLAALGAPINPLEYLTPGGLVRNLDRVAKQNAIEAKYTAKDTDRAWDVYNNKSDFGDNNKKLLSLIKVNGKSLTESQIETLIAYNRSAREVEASNAGIKLAQTKDDKKDAKAGESATEKAIKEAERWNDLMYRSSRVLSEMGKDSLPTVESATETFNKTATKLRDAINNHDYTKSENYLKEASDQRSDLEKTKAFWEAATKRYDLDVAKNAETTLSYVEAQNELSEANIKVKNALDAQDYEGYIKASNEKAKAEIDVRKATEATTKSMKSLEQAFQSMGDIASNLGLNGSGVTSFASTINLLTDNNALTQLANTQYNGDKTKATNAAYASVLSSLGTVAGGGVGKFLGSAASGFSIATGLGAAALGPIGIGAAVLGGLTSLIGGDSQAKEQRDQSRQSVYGNILQSALNGGTRSLEILKAGGYSYSGVANVHMAGDSRDRLLEDRGTEGLNALQQSINVLDQAGKTISEFVTPATLRDIQSANVQLEYTVSQIGANADATAAYWDGLIESVTGASADTIASEISSAISNSTAAYDAGASFADSFKSAISTSIQSMAEQAFVSSVAIPLLQPVLQEITASLISGDYSISSMASMIDKATEAANQLSPAINALSQSFAGAGLTAEKALAATKSDTLSSLSVLQKSIDAQKLALQTEYNAAIERSGLVIESVTQRIERLASFVTSVDSAISSVTAPSMDTYASVLSAQASISGAALLARSTGQLPADGELTDALTSIKSMSTRFYGTVIDYNRDAARTAANLRTLSGVAGEQKTVAQQSLDALTAANDNLKKTYDLEVEGLGKIYTQWSSFVDQVNGVDSSVLSVADAINGVNDAVRRQLEVSYVQSVESGAAQLSVLTETYDNQVAELGRLNGQSQDQAASLSGLWASSIDVLNTGINQAQLVAQGVDVSKQQLSALQEIIDQSKSGPILTTDNTMAAWGNTINNTLVSGVERLRTAIDDISMSVNVYGDGTLNAGITGVNDRLTGLNNTLRSLWVNTVGESHLVSSGKSPAYTVYTPYPAFAKGGQFVAGEDGPEVVTVTGGAHIANADDSRRLLRFDELVDTNKRIIRELEALRRAVEKSGDKGISEDIRTILRDFQINGVTTA
ncbi:MAG: hypothetical protein HGB35_00030 [Geobacteraceae bacterium]|nr:hypothetical protein [Geobacteraceae bacterium]